MFYRDRNLREIEKLDPVVRERAGVLLVWLEQQGEDVLITRSKVTAEEQTYLWEQGRTRPGKIITYVQGDSSFHVWGVAFDVVPVGVFGELRYGDSAAFDRIAKVAEQLGFEWGYRLWDFDKPHFQYTQGLTIPDFRMGKKLYPQNVAPTREELEKQLRVAERALDRASPRRRSLLLRFITRAAKIVRGV